MKNEQILLRVPVGVSGRHVHLSPEHVEALFGEGHELTVYRELSQPGQFAAEEKVTLVGPRGVIEGVRVLGPARGSTQVEIARTDGFRLGIHAPVRLSGDLEGTPGIALVGPKGAIYINQGVIVAARHIHMTPEQAAETGLADGDVVRVRANGERALTFDDVIIRVRDDFALDFHIDTDEANAAGLKTGDTAEILEKVNSR